MKFFHVYNEDCFRGLEKNGMINKNTGFKIQHNFSMPEERKFNKIAAIGGKLHSMIKEEKIPFYVDRLQGGTTYHKYDFDKKLIEEYENILGDWFLGFQLHESASNRRDSDWARLLKSFGHKGPYPIEELDKIKRPSSVMPTGEVLHAFSQGSIEDYSKLTYAETIEEFCEEMRQLFVETQARLGRILPVDSYYLMTKIQDEVGVRTFMPEVGSQIPLMRLAVALARGTAKAKGKTWGTYYECWHHYLDGSARYAAGMPCFNLEPMNEWYLKQENHGDDFTSFGENGGSSRLLQNRIYYHSLMSGAHYIGEEWGLNCSYYDMQEFTLSPYGEVKRDFIKETEDIEGVEPLTPFAVVLPKKCSFIQLRDPIMKLRPDWYMCTTVSKADRDYYRHVDSVLGIFFDRAGKEYGNEGHVIANSCFGDVFDIIYEDTSLDVMKKYDCLIDASPDGSFAKKMEDSGLKILESADKEKLKSELSKLIPEIMPVSVSDLCWLVSTDDKNRRYLSIFNNEGNMRTIQVGDLIDNDADRVVNVTFKTPTEIKVMKEGNFPSEIERIDGSTYRIKIPATAFLILEL